MPEGDLEKLRELADDGFGPAMSHRLLDRLEKLEAVAEAACTVMNHPAAKERRIQPAQGRALNQALDALDSEEDGPCPIAR